MKKEKYLKDGDISYSIGAFPTIELINKKIDRITKILIHEKLKPSDDIETALNIAKKHRIPIIKDSNTIEKLSGKGNVFIVGVFKKFESTLQENKNHILLVNPSDMGNLGTIIRVALGFGYRNIALITPCIDHFDPKVIRASMGSIFSVNIETFDSYDTYKKTFNNYPYSFMLQTDTTLQSLKDKKSPHTLIFGNEASGLESYFLNIGTPLRIEHSKNIDSLNLSMSVGIALYEFSK